MKNNFLLKIKQKIYNNYFWNAKQKDWHWFNVKDISNNSGKIILYFDKNEEEELNKALYKTKELKNKGFFFKHTSLNMIKNKMNLISFIFYFDAYDNIENVKNFYKIIKNEFNFLGYKIFLFRSNFETKWKMHMNIYYLNEEGDVIVSRPNYLNYQKWTKNNFSYKEQDLSNYRKRNWKTYNLPKEEYIILDVETTGLCIDSNEIIEIGAIKIKNQEIVEEFSQIINIKKEINPFIVHLTGINQRMINSGNDKHQVAIDFFNFIQGYKIVAHNSEFDRKFINKLFNYYSMKNIDKKDSINSISIFRNMYFGEKSYALECLSKRKLPFIKQKHRAIEDCKLLLRLLKEENVEKDILNNNYKKLYKEYWINDLKNYMI